MLEITINFKNGNKIKQKINYIAYEEGKIIYTKYRNPTPLWLERIEQNIEEIENFVVYDE